MGPVLPGVWPGAGYPRHRGWRRQCRAYGCGRPVDTTRRQERPRVRWLRQGRGCNSTANVGLRCQLDLLWPELAQHQLVPVVLVSSGMVAYRGRLKAGLAQGGNQTSTEGVVAGVARSRLPPAIQCSLNGRQCGSASVWRSWVANASLTCPVLAALDFADIKKDSEWFRGEILEVRIDRVAKCGHPAVGVVDAGIADEYAIFCAGHLSPVGW